MSTVFRYCNSGGRIRRIETHFQFLLRTSQQEVLTINSAQAIGNINYLSVWSFQITYYFLCNFIFMELLENPKSQLYPQPVSLDAVPFHNKLFPHVIVVLFVSSSHGKNLFNICKASLPKGLSASRPPHLS